ncbi:MAG TPA: DNA polymerase Y family protein, partial [Candidatus Ruania gallistercoris]|nr:DNA polymerase Y family protein [Candidatus Ruania gallistercoris]
LSGRSGRPPSAPLTHLALTAEEVTPAAAVQEGLWGRSGRGERQAGRAALRIQGLLGADGVLAPVAEGGRSPRDRIRLVAWGDELSPVRDPDAPWPGQIPRPLPARVPTEPVPIHLLDADGEPVQVDERGQLNRPPSTVQDAPQPGTSPHQGAVPRSGAAQRQFAVTGWAGPWPVVERWWTGQADRHYLQVTGAGHALLLAGDADGWWIEGIYD